MCSGSVWLWNLHTKPSFLSPRLVRSGAPALHESLNWFDGVHNSVPQVKAGIRTFTPQETRLIEDNPKFSKKVCITSRYWVVVNHKPALCLGEAWVQGCCDLAVLHLFWPCTGSLSVWSYCAASPRVFHLPQVSSDWRSTGCVLWSVPAVLLLDICKHHRSRCWMVNWGRGLNKKQIQNWAGYPLVHTSFALSWCRMVTLNKVQ